MVCISAREVQRQLASYPSPEANQEAAATLAKGQLVSDCNQGAGGSLPCVAAVALFIRDRRAAFRIGVEKKVETLSSGVFRYLEKQRMCSAAALYGIHQALPTASRDPTETAQAWEAAKEPVVELLNFLGGTGGRAWRCFACIPQECLIGLASLRRAVAGKSWARQWEERNIYLAWRYTWRHGQDDRDGGWSPCHRSRAEPTSEGRPTSIS